MKHLFYLLMISTFLLSACSSRQKKVCNKNTAYQHGYQAAQKGESMDNASSYQGNTCQDFEAYSPVMYRSDFKFGYMKGKKEYCSEFNYEKWGKEDGKNAKTEYPNNYSVDMKICLHDSEYKKLAKKTYDKAFNEAFCDVDRMSQMGVTQAKSFKALKLPSLKKYCGKGTSKLNTAMRKAYKEQMKTNCTTAFWVLKGEEDAVAKKSKASEITKVQKCPSSKRDEFIAQYSKSYNERKSLLIEEEKLALEKKRQEEMMDLKRKQQQQEYELAKERNQIERDRIAANRPGGTGIVPGTHFIYHNGNKLRVKCWVDQNKHVGHVKVKNLSKRNTSVSGTWKIRYYDNRKLIKTEDEYEYVSLSSFEEKSFTDNFAPWEANRCHANLR